MKVIASSLRKGNVVEIDERLYVVLQATNFHPGKGTPTTSVDMRRISDGVKVSERWKTTDQVERAHVEESRGVFELVAGNAHQGRHAERKCRDTNRRCGVEGDRAVFHVDEERIEPA